MSLKFVLHHRSWNLPLASVLLAFLILAAIYESRSEGIFSEDDVSHYLKARHVWSHFYLLSDIWGRPAYTILSSPMAHFGMRAARWFNILVTILSCFTAAEIARTLKVGRPWLAAAFTAAQPLFLQLSFGMLTEPLFGLLLAAGILFYLRGSLRWSALLISLLPAARLEGFVFLGLWFVLFVRRRRLAPALILFLIPLLWNAGGMAVTGDPIFLWNYNPYRGAAGRVSPGHWFDYLFHWPIVAGPAVLPLFTLGLLHGLLSRGNKLVHSVVLVYIALQVGIYGSGVLGFINANEAFYLRFLAAIAPLLGVVAAQGENYLFEGEPWRVAPSIKSAGLNWLPAIAVMLQTAVVTVWYWRPGSPVSIFHLLASWLVLVLAFWAVLAPDWRPAPDFFHRRGAENAEIRRGLFQKLQRGLRTMAGVILLLLALAFTLRWVKPHELRATDRIWADLGTWFVESAWRTRPVIVLDPSFWRVTPRDPFDLSGLEPFYVANDYRALKTSLSMAAPGTIVVWDSHFFGRDAGISPDLFPSEQFRILRHYSTSDDPADRYHRGNSEQFQVAVFERK